MSDRNPPATRKDHDCFCQTESWELVRNAQDRPTSHHVTYKLALHDGRILKTRISRPVTSHGDYARSLWAHILRDQLDVTSEEFWACVNDGVLPDRGQPEVREEPKAVPLHLVRELSRLGVPEEQILDLDPAGAADLLAQKYLEDQTRG